MSDVVYKILIEVLTVILGLVGSLVLYQLKLYLSRHNHYKALQIVDFITDKAVELAEANFGSGSGELKRKAAVDYASRALSSRGITVSQNDLLAGIEDGCNKLKAMKLEQSKFQAVSSTDATPDK